MKPGYLQLIFSLAMGVMPLSAEKMLNFQVRSLPVRDILAVIEAQTGYLVNLPYADSANLSKPLPEFVELKDLLNWICLYYEKHNDLVLSYTFDGKHISFNAATNLSAEERASILSKKIMLTGEGLTMANAVEVAAKSAGLAIDLPFPDPAQQKADYNYQCTLGEFLEEVCAYHREYNKLQISYAVQGDKVQFLERGRISNIPLQVELQGRKTIAIPSAEPAAPRESAGESSDSEPRKKYTAKKAADRPPFDDVLGSVMLVDVSTYLDPVDYQHIVTRLTDPHDRGASFRQLYDIILPFMKSMRGRREWEMQLLSLDDYPAMKVHEKNLQIQDLEDHWLKQIFASEQQSDRHTVKSNSFWSAKARAEAGFGNGVSKVGTSPRQRKSRDGYADWYGAGFSLDYHARPAGSWQFQYGLDADTTRKISDDGDALEHGSLALRFEGTRNLARAHILSISPYAMILHEDNLGGAADIQSHDLWLGGLKVHWAERTGVLGFNKMVSDSDFFLGTNKTKDRESVSPVARQDRDTLFPGYVQSWALINAQDGGYYGFRWQLGATYRASNANTEKGADYQAGLALLFVRPKWSSTSEVCQHIWMRDASVNRNTLAQNFDFYPWSKGERLYLRVELEQSSSADQVMDYSSRQALGGMEWTW